MTPLAMKFMRDAARSHSARNLSDPHGMIDLIRDVHCFEMSAAIEIAEAVWDLPVEVLMGTAFLPADETWIEFKKPGNIRWGFYLRSRSEGGFHFYQVRQDGCGYAGWLNPGKMSYQASTDENSSIRFKMMLVFLAVINTPKLVERRARSPHRALAREIRNAGCPLTLRPWTEIKLEISPRLASGDAGLPDRLSGRKCLHFCRSHLRVQNGRLVVVRPHWRGDATLGVTQATYRVAA